MFSPHDLTAHLVWLNEPTPGSLPPNVLPGSASDGPPNSLGNPAWLPVGEDGTGHVEGVPAAVATNMSNSFESCS